MPSSPIRVRKMGTRAGQPHYGCDCNVCGLVLAVAHLDKAGATDIAKAHVIREHYGRVPASWLRP